MSFESPYDPSSLLPCSHILSELNDWRGLKVSETSTVFRLPGGNNFALETDKVNKYMWQIK